MSVGEAFRSMFMRIADHFLDMAAQMMAAQISKGFLGLFGNAFGGFSFGGSASAFPNAFDTSFDTSLLNFANGGRPPVGRPSIVGERGAELFVPNRAGTIIPNHELGGMGSSTNIVVNVDASGSNVEGDEEQGRELGRLISVAVQSEIIQQQRPGGLLA
jgi:phage-related minor tail protein